MGRLLLLLGVLNAVACGSAESAISSGRQSRVAAALGETPGETPDQVFEAIGPANLADAAQDTIQQATAGSAPRVYLIALSPVFVVNRPAGGASEDCPERGARDGFEVLRGGCTAADGTEWTGEVRIERSEERSRLGRIVFDRFGYRQTLDCPDQPDADSRWISHGTFVAEGMENDLRFSIAVAFDGSGVDRRCEPFLGRGALEYEGTLSAEGQRTLWNGEGRLGWETFGWFRARTENEITDSGACVSEALSGTTTLESVGHRVRVLYDGADQCDEEARVPWYRDGVRQAEPLAPVACGAGGPPVTYWPLAFVLIVIAYRSFSRRERSRVMFFW